LVAYAILTVAYPFALNVALERGSRAEGLLLASGLAALLAWVAFSILTRHADEVVLALLAGSALIVVGPLGGRDALARSRVHVTPRHRFGAF